MKKAFLLLFAAYLGTSCFAQRTVTTHEAHVTNAPSGVAARTTGAGSTYTLTNIAASDTLVVISYTGTAHGYVTGTNSYNDKAFAERYFFNGHDSSLKVIGIMAQFGGKVASTSSKVVNFKVWDITAPKRVSGTVVYEGYPNNTVNTLTVPFTQLGIAAAGDTMKSFTFATPSITLNGAFFIGYDMNYTFTSLSGDTIGLASTQNGHRSISLYNVVYTFGDSGDTTHIDTVMHVQNATQWADNNWHENYTENDSIFNDLAIFPIVLIGGPTGVNSVTKNNLSLFGNYPNPATTATNIKFSIATPTTVTINLLDMSGKLVNNISSQSYNAGDHTVSVATDNLPAGNYIYTIKTAAGDALAGQLSVIK